jgi:hypothetical protein
MNHENELNLEHKREQTIKSFYGLENVWRVYHSAINILQEIELRIREFLPSFWNTVTRASDILFISWPLAFSHSNVL